jgi:penicillin-binding protein 2
MQLAQVEDSRQSADDNRIRIVPRPPERGRIVDRNGLLLAGSQLSYGVFLWPRTHSTADWKPIIERLARYLDVPSAEITSRLEQVGYTSPFPVRILRNANPAAITRLEENSALLPGMAIQPEAIRYYPNKTLAAHLLGYTGEISLDELKAAPTVAGYRMGDVVGRMGAEQVFETELRGQWGGQQVEVNASGDVKRVLGDRPSKVGHTVQLALDKSLQQVAETALEQQKGAVVALDPRDGTILVMASHPTFDPNLFSGSVTEDQWKALQALEFPFLNRNLRAYPPASTFKIVTATAGLESKAFSPTTTLQTYPYIHVGGWNFWDWNRAGFGVLNFPQAIAYSSDTFFYQVALRTGATHIQEWAHRYGFGQPTGIGLGGESPGLVPDETWKEKILGEKGWYAGDTVNMSIGQGLTTATPLQIARMTAAVANGGWRVTPHLSLSPAVPPAREKVGLHADTIKVLQDGMRAVVASGTGARVALPPDLPAISGKSGTAEAPPLPDHAWFTSYAPSENPEIVVVAFLENSGGGGSSRAGPVVRQVLETYFRQQQNAKNP